MGERILCTFDGGRLHAELNDTDTARTFFSNLPMEIPMTRWGDEYYGSCGLSMPLEKGARADMELGELAYWPGGSALCIFFGPTPASTDERPRAISPVNPIGIAENWEFLRDLPSSVSVRIEPLTE